MVKIQKPNPKTLDKKENVKMKPKLGKVKKASDGKASTGVSVAVPKKNKKNEKSGKKQEAKNQLIKDAVKEAKNIVPVKKSKNLVAENSKQKKENANNKQKAPKKPLILAPPESPAAPPSSNSLNPKKSKKAKKSNANGDVPIVEDKKNTVSALVKAKSEKLKQLKQVKQKKKKSVAVKASAQIGPKTKAQTNKANIQAFQKSERVKRLNQATSKDTNKKKKQNAEAVGTMKFEALPFDEEKFNEIVTVSNIKKVCKALKELVQKEVANKKTSIFDDYKYMLTVGSFKIANCPKRMVKLKLKHSLVDKDDDVVIVVPDLQRGAKVDYDPTIQHYEDIFREAGVEGLKIMPFNQLRTECNTFEALRKLSNTYDYFMVDGRIAGHTSGFCGKVFQKPRTTFHSVRLDNPNAIKKEVEKSLHKTAFRQLMKGDLITIPVATHKHSAKEIAENIALIVEQLKEEHPGGWGNIRKMCVKIDITGTSSLPIYISMAQPPEKTPYVVGPREQRMLKLRKDANDVLSKFALTKDADILRLSKTQIERKRKMQETRELLIAEKKAEAKKQRREDEEIVAGGNGDNNVHEDEDAEVDEDDEEEENDDEDVENDDEDEEDDDEDEDEEDDDDEE